MGRRVKVTLVAANATTVNGAGSNKGRPVTCPASYCTVLAADRNHKLFAMQSNANEQLKFTASIRPSRGSGSIRIVAMLASRSCCGTLSATTETDRDGVHCSRALWTAKDA